MFVDVNLHSGAFESLGEHETFVLEGIVSGEEEVRFLSLLDKRIFGRELISA